MAQLEAVQFAALLEAIAAERRMVVNSGPKGHNAIARVLATAHLLGRRSSSQIADRKIS